MIKKDEKNEKDFFNTNHPANPANLDTYNRHSKTLVMDLILCFMNSPRLEHHDIPHYIIIN